MADLESSQSRALVLAEKIRDQRVVIDEVPATRSTRLLVWAFFLMVAALVGLAEVANVIGSQQKAVALPRRGGPLPTADPCLARMDRMLTAVAAYGREHGKPPSDLAALSPKYIAEPALCPFTQTPYGYDSSTRRPSISCQANHAKHADAGP